MAKIYITGHRNPDLDTVCSAYAYANFKTILDPDNEYIPVRCGHLSANIKKVLAEFNITPPPYMHDVYPKVRDVMLTEDRRIDASTSLQEVAKTFNVVNPSASPVYDGDKFYGLMTYDDIASWYMKDIVDGKPSLDIPTVKDIMGTQEEPIQADERFDEAKSLFTLAKHRGIPVMNGDEFVGFVTRRCFLKKPAYNVIMVDHNEPEQSIPGIETANIVEIIDHHRLDSVKTEIPIFIDAEPLGSTCTLIYQLYRRNMMTPDRETAKVLLTGIISDTLILKSPTTTILDVRSAQELSWIIGADVKDFGERLFSVVESLANRDPKEAIAADFKTYHEHGLNLGIGQCETTTLGNVNVYKDAYLAALEEHRTQHALDWAVVMITDVLHERSVLLSTDFKSTRHLPYAKLSDLVYDMPDVMSRKKQLLPEIIHSVSIDFG